MKSVIVRRIKSSGGNRGDRHPTQLTGSGDEDENGDPSSYYQTRDHRKATFTNDDSRNNGEKLDLGNRRLSKQEVMFSSQGLQATEPAIPQLTVELGGRRIFDVK